MRVCARVCTCVCGIVFIDRLDRDKARTTMDRVSSILHDNNVCRSASVRARVYARMCARVYTFIYGLSIIVYALVCASVCGILFIHSWNRDKGSTTMDRLGSLNLHEDNVCTRACVCVCARVCACVRVLLCAFKKVLV